MSLGPVTRYETDGGALIYRVPARVFPALVANVYFVVAGEYVALIDTGSGLGESDGPLSPHLRSRREVGRVLRESGVPVIEFRASIIIGSGLYVIWREHQLRKRATLPPMPPLA